MKLTKEQLERYSRQIVLPEIGSKGQKKLLTAKVLIIGCGGLGSSCAYYLTAAGVGNIGLVDADVVSLDNLQRQILHFSADIGKPKVESAKEKLRSLNPTVRLNTYHTRITSKNVIDIIKNYDVIIDSTDNFPTKYLLNDACVFESKPLIHASVLKFYGQATTILPKKGPCYRCIFPQPPQPSATLSCQQEGVLGVVAGFLGIVQATETIKYIVGVGENLVGWLFIFNGLELSCRKIKINKKFNCSVCGKHPVVKDFIDYECFCGIKK